MSKSVLSKGLAIRAASAAASAMVSVVSERPTRNRAAASATRGREAAEPITIRASATTHPSFVAAQHAAPVLLVALRRTAAATDKTGKSNDPRRRNFQ